MTIGIITGRGLAPAAITAAVVGPVFAGCEQQPVAHGLCDGTLVGTTVGTLTDDSLVEVSGIAASARNPGTLWMHNDSGDRARVAPSPSPATPVATYSVTGAAAEDWEDMAVGPGPVAGESYLYLGDIGDNGADRDDIVVYRIPEPTVTGGGSQTLAGAEALTLRYPDGPRNAEALFVDPSYRRARTSSRSRATAGPVHIFRAPANLAAGSTTELTRVGILDLPDGSSSSVTGAAITNDGTAIAVRTYGDVRIWDRGAGQSIAAALDGVGCRGPDRPSRQGEAMTFLPDGPATTRSARATARRSTATTARDPTLRSGLVTLGANQFAALDDGGRVVEPAGEDAMQRRRGEDRLGRRDEVDGVQEERMGLRPADAAVRADLVLERGDLDEVGVVAAVDHQIGDRRVAIDLADLLAGPGTERQQRIDADHAAGGEVEAALVAEHDRRAIVLPHEHEPDLRVAGESADQPG